MSSTITVKMNANGVLDTFEDLLRARALDLQDQKAKLQDRITEINAELATLASIRADVIRKRSA